MIQIKKNRAKAPTSSQPLLKGLDYKLNNK